MGRSSNAQLAKINKRKFLQPPTIQQIEAVVKKFNVSEYQFERFFGLYAGTIKQVRIGFRPMPPQHWHLFLEELNLQQRTKIIGDNSVSIPVSKLVRKSKSKHKPSPDSKLGQLMQ